jgi:hypothetical protein
MPNVPDLDGFLDVADALVPCAVCGATEGVPCTGLPPGFVHFGRRLARMMLTADRPERRAEFERRAIELLRRFVRERVLALN